MWEMDYSRHHENIIFQDAHLFLQASPLSLKLFTHELENNIGSWSDFWDRSLFRERTYLGMMYLCLKFKNLWLKGSR